MEIKETAITELKNVEEKEENYNVGEAIEF